MNINRGVIVAYWKNPDIPLKVISDPYMYNGQMVVTARRVAKKKNDRQQGMYLLSALVPYRTKEE